MSSTSGTARTTEELLYLFRDGQPSSAITAQDMRDFVASIPQVQGTRNVTSYGAVADGVSAADGSITASSTTLVSASANFTGREGQAIVVVGAGVAGANLVTSIFSVTNASSCVLSSAAGTTVSSARIRFGTDNAAFIQAGVDSIQEGGGGTLLFPSGVYLISSQIVLPKSVNIFGEGPLSTTIALGPSFPTSTAAIIITPDTGAYGSMVSGVCIDCQHIAGSIGVYSESVQEHSGVKGTLVTNYMSYGIHFKGAGCQNYTLEDLWIYSSSLATASTGVYLETTSSVNPVRRVTIASSGVTPPVQTTPGLRIKASCVCLDTIHIEHHADGVLFESGALGSANGIFGHPTLTNNIRIDGSSGISILNAFKNSATVNIKDNFTDRTITTEHVSLYVLGVGPGPQMITTDATYPCYLFTLNLNTLTVDYMKFLLDDAAGAGSIIQSANHNGVLLQTAAMGDVFSGGGLHLAGGGYDDNPSRGGVNAGSTSDLGTYTARGTTASGVQFQEGEVGFYTNTGLTPGVTFAPTIRIRVTTTGEVILGSGAAGIMRGTGDPNGSVTAGIGRLYLREDGGAATTLYVKESGTGNTGWVGK